MGPNCRYDRRNLSLVSKYTTDNEEECFPPLLGGQQGHNATELGLSPRTIELYLEYSKYENYKKHIIQHRSRLTEQLVADITSKENLRILCHRRRSEGLKEILKANNLPHKLVTNSNNTIRRLFSRLWR